MVKLPLRKTRRATRTSDSPSRGPLGVLWPTNGQHRSTPRDPCFGSRNLQSLDSCFVRFGSASMPQPATARRHEIVDFAALAGVACPCGTARRAFVDVADLPVTIHQTEISSDARLHYHRKLTEVYYVLDCDSDARMELDDELIPLRPGRCVMIPPGVRHRAIGKMTVLVIVTPKFDPADEWFD
jgi:mannose-6-phosphate isomerase-like protein (cupin superfamily)